MNSHAWSRRVDRSANLRDERMENSTGRTQIARIWEVKMEAVRTSPPVKGAGVADASASQDPKNQAYAHA